MHKTHVSMQVKTVYSKNAWGTEVNIMMLIDMNSWLQLMNSVFEYS